METKENLVKKSAKHTISHKSNIHSARQLVMNRLVMVSCHKWLVLCFVMHNLEAT